MAFFDFIRRLFKPKMYDSRLFHPCSQVCNELYKKLIFMDSSFVPFVVSVLPTFTLDCQKVRVQYFASDSVVAETIELVLTERAQRSISIHSLNIALQIVWINDFIFITSPALSKGQKFKIPIWITQNS